MSKNKSKQYFQGKDSFSRMNFLFQASMLMSGRNQVLSAYFGNLCKSIGKKSVLRIDPDLKRTLCKKCSLAQRPGVTAELSVVSEKPERESSACRRTDIDSGSRITVKCMKCAQKRRFKVDTNYKFWLEKRESIAEVTKFQTECDMSHTDPEHKRNEVTET